jgi:hypothetical protein
VLTGHVTGQSRSVAEEVPELLRAFLAGNLRQLNLVTGYVGSSRLGRVIYGASFGATAVVLSYAVVQAVRYRRRPSDPEGWLWACFLGVGITYWLAIFGLVCLRAQPAFDFAGGRFIMPCVPLLLMALVAYADHNTTRFRHISRTWLAIPVAAVCLNVAAIPYYRVRVAQAPAGLSSLRDLDRQYASIAAGDVVITTNPNLLFARPDVYVVFYYPHRDFAETARMAWSWRQPHVFLDVGAELPPIPPEFRVADTPTGSAGDRVLHTLHRREGAAATDS